VTGPSVAACENGSMADEDPDRNSFEDVARAFADEVNRAVERLSEIDVEDIATRAREEAERARRWLDELTRSMGRETEPAGERERDVPFHAPDDPFRHADPHPLDLPTAEQGVALAALDSGRWKLEPGTSTFAVLSDGPAPSDAMGLVRELRVRDWISADGEVTLAGRKALARWLDAAG
jgi:hypothetical protein